MSDVVINSKNQSIQIQFQLSFHCLSYLFSSHNLNVIHHLCFHSFSYIHIPKSSSASFSTPSYHPKWSKDWKTLQSRVNPDTLLEGFNHGITSSKSTCQATILVLLTKQCMAFLVSIWFRKLPRLGKQLPFRTKTFHKALVLFHLDHMKRSYRL